MPSKNFRQLLQYLLDEFKIEQQPSQHWRRLHIVLCIPKEMRTEMSVLPFPLFRFAHRVVLKEQGVYGLKEDIEETELLNESGSAVTR